MRKHRCGNPNCNKLFSDDRPGRNNRKYCCAKCKDVARDLRCGSIASKDDFDFWRRGYLKLPNGMEIRNDAMGKEISQSLLVFP
jgi:hypothetical protein